MFLHLWCIVLHCLSWFYPTSFLHSHCAKLHISLTSYWLSTRHYYDQDDTEVCNEKPVSRNVFHIYNTPQCVSTTGNVLWVHLIEARPAKLTSTQNVGLEPILIIIKTFIKKNLTMNITSKHNLSFNADSQKLLFWSIANFTTYCVISVCEQQLPDSFKDICHGHVILFFICVGDCQLTYYQIYISFNHSSYEIKRIFSG